MKTIKLSLMVLFLFCGCSSLETSYSQKGWRIQSDSVDLFITRLGGQMAPVYFYTNTNQPIQPYYLSPWQKEKTDKSLFPVLVPLRGDFFCLPYGSNDIPYNGERHPVHGETAAANWNFIDKTYNSGITCLTLAMDTKVRKGRITKKLYLMDGQNVIYSSHIIEGISGKMPVGHHCILDVPEKENSLRVAVSEFTFGITHPVLYANPACGAYQSTAVNAVFHDLHKVPLMAAPSESADFTSFPQRAGYTDLFQIFRSSSSEPAWTAAVYPERGYLWFCLQDSAVLPGTVFWMDNKGQYHFPWNGRNRCLGLEPTCSYSIMGLVPSLQPNPVNEQGIPTAITFSPDHPTVINFIQGVVKIPTGFDSVQDIKCTENQITIFSINHKTVSIGVNSDFIRNGIVKRY